MTLPFLYITAAAASAAIWNVNLQIAFSSIVKSRIERGREMGNEIKMSLDTLIDFNCSVAHCMEVVVGVNHIGHHHRHRCNDNKKQRMHCPWCNHHVSVNGGTETRCSHNCRLSVWAIGSTHTIWLFNLCVSLVSPFYSISLSLSLSAKPLHFIRRAINNVTIHFIERQTNQMWNLEINETNGANGSTNS